MIFGYLTSEDIARIDASTLRLLERMGAKIESEIIRASLIEMVRGILDAPCEPVLDDRQLRGLMEIEKKWLERAVTQGRRLRRPKRAGQVLPLHEIASSLHSSQ